MHNYLVLNKLISDILNLRLVINLFFILSFTQISLAQFSPASDPSNSDNWVLLTDLSDEFNQVSLNETKWHIQGTNGVFVSNFKGRSPSQFSIDNVRLENDKLKLETRWEPDYNFSPTVDNNGDPYENITTAAVISKNEFVYGYLEIKSKAADCEITSSFWATGNNTEFDFFEMFGDHKQPIKEVNGKERELWWSIHDWTSAGSGRTTYTEHYDLGFRVADAYHIYGYEWDENGVKIYIDGVLLKSISKIEINNYDDVTHNNGGNGTNENYVITKPIKIWFDQETFPWHGVPDSLEEVGGDGSIDFEIEYIRVWQKNNILSIPTNQLKQTKIYPNPISNNKLLKISNIEATNISIYNISGIKVLDIKKIAEPIEVSLNGLSAGVYFIEVKSNTSTERNKIIIE